MKKKIQDKKKKIREKLVKQKLLRKRIYLNKQQKDEREEELKKKSLQEVLSPIVNNQKEILEENIAIWKKLEEEHIQALEARKNLNLSLEEQGISKIDEKFKKIS